MHCRLLPLQAPTPSATQQQEQEGQQEEGQQPDGQQPDGQQPDGQQQEQHGSGQPRGGRRQWGLQQLTSPPSALTLYLHSLLGSAKQHRLTAKLQPLAAEPAGRLQQLLCRSELSPSLHLLLAPLGGSLQALAPPVNDFAGALASSASAGSSGPLAAGHGLWGPAASGTGGALTWMSGDLSLSAGTFFASECLGASALERPLAGWLGGCMHAGWLGACNGCMLGARHRAPAGRLAGAS